MRLDKLLAHLGLGSRKDVKKILKAKRVKINGEITVKPNIQFDPKQDTLKVDDVIMHYEEKIYLMLHKPSGVISATEDYFDETVIDLLPQIYQNRRLFPVGRLDKDTEGLLLLTNDGDIGHILTSPKHEISKVYYAEIDGYVRPEHIKEFKDGITLDDGYQCKPAKLKIIKSDLQSEILITIHEGKFHQVKRMFQAIGCEVEYLKRIKMGHIDLDKDLPIGEFRNLNKEEMAYLKSLNNKL